MYVVMVGGTIGLGVFVAGATLYGRVRALRRRLRWLDPDGHW